MGNNALHYAAGWGNAGMVGMLLAEGTDYNVKNVVSSTCEGNCFDGFNDLGNTSHGQCVNTHDDTLSVTSLDDRKDRLL